MPNDMPISQDKAIKQVVAELEGPITVDEFVARVLALWPSRAKKPESTIKQTLHWQHTGKTLIFLNNQTIAPIHIALQGITFRIPLAPEEVEQGLLFVYPNFTYFLPYEVPAEQVELLDASGQPISSRVVDVKETKKSPLGGEYTSTQIAFDLSQWFAQRQIKEGDSLLVTVENWQARQFRLAHEPARVRQQRQTEIESRNRELVDLIFEQLETARDEAVMGHEAVLTAYARLPNPTGYPGDHWQEVLKQDGRMVWLGHDIRYADSFSPLDWPFLGLEEEEQLEPLSLSPEEARQVYQFRAALQYRKGLWRQIELQGEHTLGDFDRLLRDAFQHDSSDHLSGFWKLVRRGQSRRFREVDLGTINPFGEGEATDLLIAGLELKPGDQLKYVYDFGDWIKHRITLEAITEPQQGVRYPRIAAQNKLRYRYCRHCREEGKKTVATWICIDCSNEEQEDVLVCEACLETHHPDHYADEILY